MVKYVIFGVMGFAITAALIVNVAPIGVAGKAAFSEFFSSGSHEHIAAEIPLDAIPITQGGNSAIDRKPHATTSGSAFAISTHTSGRVIAVPKKSEIVPAKESPSNHSATSSVPLPPPVMADSIVISEIMAGAPDNPSYEFIELVNRGDVPADLTGWSIKKKTAGGSESTLVSSSRLGGKIIPPHKHFLLANAGGWKGIPAPDILWPQSYSLSYASNTIAFYDAKGVVVDTVSWSEIPAGKSYARDPETGTQFVILNVPTPENSGQVH